MTPQEYIDHERWRVRTNLGWAQYGGDDETARRLEEILQALDELERRIKPTVTLAQAEEMRGEWIIGEQNVLGLGVPIHCSRCGWGTDHGIYKAWMEYGGHVFCGHCGAPMTDEAVQIVMERLDDALNRKEEEHG